MRILTFSLIIEMSVSLAITCTVKNFLLHKAVAAFQNTQPISNAVISLLGKENLCHHTEIRPDMEGFDFFYF